MSARAGGDQPDRVDSSAGAFCLICAAAFVARILASVWEDYPFSGGTRRRHRGTGDLDSGLHRDAAALRRHTTVCCGVWLLQEDSRREFVSNVSHELKTPITSMKVLADSLLAQDNVPVELYKEFMGDIAEEIDRENKIITDLLSLVKMDRRSSDVNIQETNINQLIELILKRLRPIAAKRSIELVLESFKPVIAEVDETKLTLALSNLVENGIKYNKDEGWVHVSLNVDSKYFYVKVEDSGIGIPEESQEHIFERFYRVDKSHSREIGGTGLGLAITRSAVLMHHGAIKVYSREGEGTTFTVRIPLKYTA